MAAGEALGVVFSSGFTGGMATPADIRLLREGRSVIVADRPDATILGEQRIAAVVEQVQVEVLVGLLLVIAVDDDGDGLRRFTGVEGHGAGLGDIVAVAGLGGPVD